MISLTCECWQLVGRFGEVLAETHRSQHRRTKCYLLRGPAGLLEPGAPGIQTKRDEFEGSGVHLTTIFCKLAFPGVADRITVSSRLQASRSSMKASRVAHQSNIGTARTLCLRSFVTLRSKAKGTLAMRCSRKHKPSGALLAALRVCRDDSICPILRQWKRNSQCNGQRGSGSF
jgi:hypothetical protein